MPIREDTHPPPFSTGPPTHRCAMLSSLDQADSNSTQEPCRVAAWSRTGSQRNHRDYAVRSVLRAKSNRLRANIGPGTKRPGRSGLSYALNRSGARDG